MLKPGKVKDARRRARNQQRRALRVFGAQTTTAKVIPDRRKKLIKRAETKDEY